MWNFLVSPRKYGLVQLPLEFCMMSQHVIWFCIFICIVVTIFLQILRCISQLELAQLIGTGVKTKYIPSHSKNKSDGGHPIEAFDPEG